MTDTPLSERRRIVLWGRRNAGKSSLLNRLVGQEASIVSPVPGTTTDTVTRAMEILPAGPVALTDTAGIDDTDTLGPARVARTLEALRQADLALWVIPHGVDPLSEEREVLSSLQQRSTAVLAVRTWCPQGVVPLPPVPGLSTLGVDNAEGRGHRELVVKIGELLAAQQPEPGPLEGLVGPGDLVVLVTPIDLAAPKGRLILPQVETLRDALDREAACLVLKERELAWHADVVRRARLVVTDSQAFARVAADLPPELPLTSFSLLFARKKGDLAAMLPAVEALHRLRPGARVLIWEACRHARQPDDIATTKIPRLLQTLYQPEVSWEVTRKWPAPEELRTWDLILTCGGCSVTRTWMMAHLREALGAGVPVMNFGLFLAAANGLLPRAVECLLQDRRRSHARV